MRKAAPVIWQVRSEARSLGVTDGLWGGGRGSAEAAAAEVGGGRQESSKSEVGESEEKLKWTAGWRK